MEQFMHWILLGGEMLLTILVLLVFVLLVMAVVYYLIDITQTRHAVRRNYPVIGRFRYAFEHMGTFFRQYFFAMDREEMPFNRAERAWIYRAAKNEDQTVAFGSTAPIHTPGTVLFQNGVFGVLEEEIRKPSTLVIGPGCQHPYEAKSIFNVSGMSFGAISKPAVLALSNGARLAGCWMNTGEGGLSPWHLQGGADIVFQIG
ncbi:MAG: FMN-binding glutamate synthase family protein, partial [Gammaproteobacteria bacterium]